MCIGISLEQVAENHRKRWAGNSPKRPAKLYKQSRRIMRADRRRADHFYDLCHQLCISDDIKAVKR